MGRWRSFSVTEDQEEILKGIRTEWGLSLSEIVDEAMGSYLWNHYRREWPIYYRQVARPVREDRHPRRGNMIIEGVYLTDEQDAMVEEVKRKEGDSYGFFSALIEAAFEEYLPERFNLSGWPRQERLVPL